MNFSNLALGTVQFGTHYGVNNSAGQTQLDEAFKIITRATEAGIVFLDTARAYGAAEDVVGAYLKNHSSLRSRLRISTKIAPFTNQSEYLKQATLSFETSLAALHLEQVDVLMFHRWSDKKALNFNEFKLRHQKQYKKFGVSALNISEATEALNDADVKFIQLPCNLLDLRFLNNEFARACQKRTDVEIQIRSAALQGVLANDFNQNKNLAGHDMSGILSEVDRLVTRLGRQSRLDLAYAYVRSLAWAQSVIFGVDSLRQLEENLRLFARPVLKDDEVRIAQECVRALKIAEEVLNPYQWQVIN